jgi:hypothetical protein
MMVDSGHAVQLLRRGGNPMLEEVGHKIYMICPWASGVRVSLECLDTIATLLRDQGLCAVPPPSIFGLEEIQELLRHLDGAVFVSGWDLIPEGRNLHGSTQTSGKTVYYIDISHIQDLEDIPMLLASNRIVFEWSIRKLNTFFLEQIDHELCQ